MSGKLQPESFPEYSATTSTLNPDSILSQQPQLAPEYVILIPHNCILNENEVIQKSPNSSSTFFFVYPLPLSPCLLVHKSSIKQPTSPNYSI
jgi:hypothetical protein